MRFQSTEAPLIEEMTLSMRMKGLIPCSLKEKLFTGSLGNFSLLNSIVEILGDDLVCWKKSLITCSLFRSFLALFGTFLSLYSILWNELLLNNKNGLRFKFESIN